MTIWASIYLKQQQRVWHRTQVHTVYWHAKWFDEGEHFVETNTFEKASHQGK